MNVSKEPRRGLRFPRTAKLLKHSDFQRVYKSGKRHFSGLMTVFYLPRPDAAAGPRIGITVSRALGGAVERNRIKRRMREAVRLHLAGITSSMDVVFNPKKIVATAQFVPLKEEVARAFDVIEKAAVRMSSKERSSAQ
ncbi:MAG TPA: ribonuclease P protein component [Terriglobales bacterium]|nr:ribonuclease P protein component [Terriglobales bacterium]